MTDLNVLARYRFEGKSEQAVREEWIRPLLVQLGYGIDTLNEVQYETQLGLAAPFRRIGRDRVKIDYVPTVLGHGLWIIEAKAHGRDNWDEAISQAWLYATHPKIDVPFMVIADGSRIAVYDVNRPEWDKPVVDIPTSELATRFSELATVLGAANITRAVRQRQLRHLSAAMQAELSVARLQEYVTDVQHIAAEARPAVSENETAVLRDQLALEDRAREDALRNVGLFALGVWMNQPLPLSPQFAAKGVELVMSLEPEKRLGELQRLRQAAIVKSPPNPSPDPRMFWMLRFTELEIYLSLRDADGCGEHARKFARAAMRDHLLNFPEDPVARAAHRLEKALPTFVLRALLRPEGVDLAQVARQIQQDWGDEARLRARLDGDRLLVDRTIEISTSLWRSLPWTADKLDETAAALEMLIAGLDYSTDGASGPAGDPYLAFHLRADDLRIQALAQLEQHFTPDLVDEEIRGALVRFAETDEGIDDRFVKDPARRLLARLEGSASQSKD